jgi:hypothetical protein
MELNVKCYVVNLLTVLRNSLDLSKLLFECWMIMIPGNYEGKPRRRIMVPSSLNELFTEQRYSACPPFQQAGYTLD